MGYAEHYIPRRIADYQTRTVADELKKPMGDASNNILTNPIFLMGRNSLTDANSSSNGGSSKYKSSNWWKTNQNWLDPTYKKFYDNTSAHDGTTLIPELTQSPWTGYVDISSNPDISLNGYFGNEALSNVNLLTIDYTDNYNLDMRSYFQSINDGTSGIKALLYIINAYNKSEYAIFRWSNFTDKVT